MWINLDENELRIIQQCLNAATQGAGIPSPNQAQPVIDRLVATGVGQAVPEMLQFRTAAEGRYLSHPWTDGDVDIDDDAFVSDSDDGAYVMGWFWVSNELAGIENDAEEGQ